MKNYSLAIALFASLSVLAQDKQLTMEDAVIGLGTNLRVESLSQLKWIPDENSFTEAVKTSYGNALVLRTLPSLKTDTLARSNEFTDMKSVPSLSWIDKNTASYRNAQDFMIWNRETKSSEKLLTIPENTEAQEFESATSSFAYVVDNNLYLLDGKKQTHQITEDGKYGITNGKAVHQFEFGISKGMFFSPKGNLLAFYRMDETMVNDYPIIDWSKTPAVNKNIKYPFAGRDSHHVTLGVYNPKTKKTIFLETGEPKEQFLTCVTWAPDEKSIYIAVLNRDQNHMKLNQYDAQTGKYIKTLFEEKSEKYVEPQHDLYFLPNGKEFVWWSQRDGFMHLYRYDLNGKLLNQITSGQWLVNDISGKNETSNQLLITATKDGAMEKHLYAVNWKNGNIELLDSDAGYHFPSVNSNGTYVLDTWMNSTTPRKIDVYSTDKKFKKNLLTAKNPLAEYDMPKVENVTLKADDGTDLYGRMIYPTNFDANKKYPVIVYLYNGPHAQMNINRFPASGNLWYDYMAQNGYVVWVMDGRGSSNRGLEFEQAIFRNLGQVEMKDQMVGVDYLKSLPFVDGDKMGMHGWSYGGFMTTSFMLLQPDVFKAGVAGGPVMDWSMYEIMYCERYMDTPQTNPEGYAKTSLLDKTQNLKGKLLLIHGTDDNIVVWQHSIDFLRNAVSNGVQVDYFVYPGYEHNVRGKDRVHLMQKVTDYFDLYLK
ncbi:DPP IV N-terminal domain-containing protein [Xanthomarina sp. F1114]|uniref:S9 family peptidase n=1 Tax=Xanthomarina sp. F1114 TaxID=2996019 RepID=UPI00225E6550|nr:DPP IV N-terminal domain-containing protein [Xanthomarina sp. F1114]MCX7547740.1 DPP IV N-terminal domain-containing protein [Xanthomarina sp. F1114]